MDENLAHCSYEAGILEDPNVRQPSEISPLDLDLRHVSKIFLFCFRRLADFRLF